VREFCSIVSRTGRLEESQKLGGSCGWH